MLSSSQRAAHDPHFASVLARLGEGRLAEAGFFNDGATPEQLAAWRDELASPAITLPPGLIAAVRADPGATVVVTTGAMSPVHLSHVSLMDRAREALEARGVRVSAGVIAPDHDGYVMGKYGGAAALGAPWRLQLLGAALEGTWIQPWDWAALRAARDLNFTDVLARLAAELDAALPGTSVPLAYAFGSDNAGFALAFMPPGRVRAVIVERTAPVDTRLLRELAPAIASGQVTLTAQLPEDRARSSSRVRAGGGGMEPRAAALMAQWTLDWNARPGPRPAEDTWYALRDDLDLACAWMKPHWRAAEPLHVRAAAFGAGLETVIAQAFAETAWPGQPSTVRVRRVVARDQLPHARRALAEMHAAGLRPLVLDAYAADALAGELADLAASPLQLSRRFEEGGYQSRGLDLWPRPEATEPWIAASTAGHPVGILDDDIASGQTVRVIRDMLAGRRSAVERAVSLLELTLPDLGEARPPMDVCDLRDFLLGARWGGLMTAPDRRVPYLWPWVNLATRASIPPDRVRAVHTGICALGEAFFAGSGLTVAHLQGTPAFRPLRERWSPETPLGEVYAQLARQDAATGVLGAPTAQPSPA